MGVHHSTISREIRRNSSSQVYQAEIAVDTCAARHKRKHKQKRFTPELRSRVDDLLKLDYSPDQIKGYCDIEHIEMVSHETIYKYIWKDKHSGGSLYTHLRYRGRKRHKRGDKQHSRSRIVNRRDITQRPPEVDLRARFGDLEIDTVIGKNRKGAIVTINDRKTGYLWARLIPVKSAAWTAEVTTEALWPLRKHIHTITSDNGLEFANHEQISSTLGLNFYFAHTYKSSQRGSNENLNGLLRQYIPKKTDFSTITNKQLHEYCEKLNNRPRKRLRFQTPTFVLNQYLNNEVLHL